MLIRQNSVPAGSANRRRSSIFPDYISSSVADIDFRLLIDRGITTALIDLDGTVVPRGTFEVGTNIRQALQDSGLAIYIATNRPKSRDLKNLKHDLGAVGVIHPSGIYGKPSVRYFEAALRTNNLQAKEVVMIGDRYLQDILGANRAGLHTLLVNKISKPPKLLDRVFSECEEVLTKQISKSYQNSNIHNQVK